MLKMSRLKILHEVLKYLLLIVLSLSSYCLASVKTVQNEDSLEAISSRRLLNVFANSDNGNGYLQSSSRDQNNTAVIAVVVGSIVFAVIWLIRCCIKYGCEPEQENYSDAVVHAPPRSFNPGPLVAPPPAGFTTSTTTSLAPPRTSSTLIFPPDGEAFSINTTGIENPSYIFTPNYQRPSAPDSLTYGSTHETLTSLSDLPPAYETVIREDSRGPSESKPPTFPNVAWKKY